MISFHVLTLFPDLLKSAFEPTAGLLGKAVRSPFPMDDPQILNVFSIPYNVISTDVIVQECGQSEGRGTNL